MGVPPRGKVRSKRTVWLDPTDGLAELMSLADESRWDARQYDDETHRYLLAFFHEIASQPMFQELYRMLTDEEREKLGKLESNHA